jgi:hypothetical protein
MGVAFPNRRSTSGIGSRKYAAASLKDNTSLVDPFADCANWEFATGSFFVRGIVTSSNFGHIYCTARLLRPARNFRILMCRFHHRLEESPHFEIE